MLQSLLERTPLGHAIFHSALLPPPQPLAHHSLLWHGPKTLQMTGGATDEKLELKALGTAPSPTAETHTTRAKRSSSRESKPKSDASDSDTAQEDEVAFRLRELANEEEERFQGLKREHWWCVGSAVIGDR